MTNFETERHELRNHRLLGWVASFVGLLAAGGLIVTSFYLPDASAILLGGILVIPAAVWYCVHVERTARRGLIQLRAKQDRSWVGVLSSAPSLGAMSTPVIKLEHAPIVDVTCPTCGTTNRIEHGRVERAEGGGVVATCPRCGTEGVVRPNSPPTSPESPEAPA